MAFSMSREACLGLGNVANYRELHTYLLACYDAA